MHRNNAAHKPLKTHLDIRLFRCLRAPLVQIVVFFFSRLLFHMKYFFVIIIFYFRWKLFYVTWTTVHWVGQSALHMLNDLSFSLPFRFIRTSTTTELKRKMINSIYTLKLLFSEAKSSPSTFHRDGKRIKQLCRSVASKRKQLNQ